MTGALGSGGGKQKPCARSSGLLQTVQLSSLGVNGRRARSCENAVVTLYARTAGTSGGSPSGHDDLHDHAAPVVAYSKMWTFRAVPRVGFRAPRAVPGRIPTSSGPHATLAHCEGHMEHNPQSQPLRDLSASRRRRWL
jgi:hypothetical protein